MIVVNNMFYIGNTYTFELVINKSKFIAILTNIDKIDDVNEKLSNIKNEYNDADHYCYAYIIDSVCKYSDDKEPSGSAGSPILNVLTKKKLNHILCVVVRYFGGVKLGFGGLVRAYTSATLGVISKSSLISLEDALYIEMLVSYDNIKKAELILNKANILLKEFDVNIKLGFNIREYDYDNISYELSLLGNIIITKKIKIKKVYS